MTLDDIKKITLKLLDYCRANNWAGWDPYDALNSPIFKYLPFLDFRWPRIAFTQFFKRSPINFRPLLGIPKTENPKAIALFLMAFLKLKRLGLLEDTSLIALMVQKLINLRSLNNQSGQITCNLQPGTCNSQLATRNPQPATHYTPSRDSDLLTGNLQPVTCNNYFAWGYSFPWQGRSVLVPRGAPNLVCTAFVADALLDLYERSHEPEHLEMAVSSADYIVNELYWEEGDETACFSYPLPGFRSRVHNANFLGAALLCRIYKHTRDRRYLDPALKAARYSASRQRQDGSWDYGEDGTQRWVDNFHTGYNLCALRAICGYAGTSEFGSHIRRGFEFYRNRFFREDGVPKYFHNNTYPIDIHSAAQSIITLVEFSDLDRGSLDLAESVLNWVIRYLWNGDGFGYYQRHLAYTNKIPYMRWSQAWMLLALSTLLEVRTMALSQSPQRSRREHLNSAEALV